MNRFAADVGVQPWSVHIVTARGGMEKSVRSGKMTPLPSPDWENSSVTHATPSPILAREMSRLWDPSSISG